MNQSCECGYYGRLLLGYVELYLIGIRCTTSAVDLFYRCHDALIILGVSLGSEYITQIKPTQIQEIRASPISDSDLP